MRLKKHLPLSEKVPQPLPARFVFDRNTVLFVLSILIDSFPPLPHILQRPRVTMTTGPVTEIPAPESDVTTTARRSTRRTTRIAGPITDDSFVTPAAGKRGAKIQVAVRVYGVGNEE